MGWRASLLLLGLVAQPQSLFTVSGRIVGASGHHTVYVALWSEDGFLKHPTQQLRLQPETTSFRFEAPAGRWALSAFEDTNGNGVLDQGLFGPKEPSGFWPPFRKWHRPRFEEVAFRLDHDVTEASVILR